MGQSNSSREAGRRRRASGLLVLLLASPVAFADIAIQVRGVRAPLRANVLAYLSFSRYRHSKGLSEDTIERLDNRVVREVREALSPFGYFEPKVISKLTRTGPGDWRVAIDIDPGPPVILKSVVVRVVGPGARSRLFTSITSRLPFHPGEQLDQAEYEAVKGNLLRTASTYGYLDATLIRHELRVNPARRSARIDLELDTGQRYRFGATTIEQHVIRDKLVRRFLRYREGDPFDLTQVLHTQFALDDTEYFSDLEVLPGTPDRARHTVPVAIHARASRPNVYSVAGGYATDTGARGILSWQDRRVNSLGHKMSVDLEAAQVTKYSLQSHYVIPIGDPAVENLTLSGIVEQQQLADVNARTNSFGPSVTRVSGRWQTVWFLNWVHTSGTVQASATNAQGQPTSVTLGTGSADMLVPGVDIAAVPKGYLGEPIFQHGFFAEVRGSRGELGSKSRFLQVHVQFERVFELAPKWHLLIRDELGVTIASRFDAMPPQMRFFAGGEGSVRGFAYNDLSPLQQYCGISNGGRICQEFKAGGKDIATGSVEVDRDLPHNLGLAVFYDYGNAFNHFGSPLERGAGIGLRYRLPVLTLGVDIAQPLSESGSPRLYINFSPKL
jgi:translocation and assembly module TamA